jgi:hypothetical protein
MQITALWQYTDMYNPNPSMNKLNNVFSAFPVSLPASGLIMAVLIEPQQLLHHTMVHESCLSQLQVDQLHPLK